MAATAMILMATAAAVFLRGRTTLVPWLLIAVRLLSVAVRLLLEWLRLLDLGPMRGLRNRARLRAIAMRLLLKPVRLLDLGPMLRLRMVLILRPALVVVSTMVIVRLLRPYGVLRSMIPVTHRPVRDYILRMSTVVLRVEVAVVTCCLHVLHLH